MTQASNNRQEIGRGDSVPRIPFARHATITLRGMQIAVLELIATLESVTETPLRRPTDLQNMLQVHNKLAWQVHRFAHADDPLAEASNLPGSAAIRRLLDAAKRRGVPETKLAAVRKAEVAIDELIRVHAGNRSAFDSMIGELTEGGVDQIDLQHRRAAFRANSHILGMQAKTQFCCFAIMPSQEDEMKLDVLSIRGMLNLRRLRSNVSGTISTTRVVDDNGNILGNGKIELLDPDDQVNNPAGMIRRFCSQPLPKFSTVTAPDGYVNVDLPGNDVGNLSAITCVDGYVWRGSVSRYRDDHNQRGRFTCSVRNPLEVAIVDVLVHESTYDSLQLESTLYSDHRWTDHHAQGARRDVLPLRERPVHRGRSIAALRTSDVPRYTEVAEFAFDRLGWNDNNFDVYRCRVEFPFMPSSLQLYFELPDAPG